MRTVPQCRRWYFASGTPLWPVRLECPVSGGILFSAVSEVRQRVGADCDTLFDATSRVYSCCSDSESGMCRAFCFNRIHLNSRRIYSGVKNEWAVKFELEIVGFSMSRYSIIGVLSCANMTFRDAYAVYVHQFHVRLFFLASPVYFACCFSTSQAEHGQVVSQPC